MTARQMRLTLESLAKEERAQRSSLGPGPGDH